MEFTEILSDDIDAIVFGEANEEFITRMCQSDSCSYTVHECYQIKQITQIVSTRNLFLHFNFYLIPESLFQETIEILKKDIYLGIVTFLLDDIASFGKAAELYDKYVQDSSVPLKSLPGRIGICNSPVELEELLLINLWQIIPAGIKAAICSERKSFDVAE